MSRRLRIGVPDAVRAYSPRIGHGRVWSHVLEPLSRLADLRFGGGRRLDAWLVDGHAGAFEARVPVVAQIHEASWRLPEVEPHLDAGFLAAHEAATRAAAEHADWVVTASSATRDQIADVLGFPRERISVVFHGTSLRPPDGPPPVEGPYVLHAASVHPRKNLEALRAAMERLAAEGLPRRLVLVLSPAPDRPDSAALMAAATADLPGGVVRVEAPADDELAALMAGADAFVLPSHWEGFGLTALEAMGCGAPVVVAARGALPEVVGDAGLIVDPSPEGLADALRSILCDPGLAARLREAGRRRAESLTWERAAAGWLSAVRAAVEAGPR